MVVNSVRLADNLYRDRENSTVFVADLPSGSTENELKELFKDVSRPMHPQITLINAPFPYSAAKYEKSSLPSYKAPWSPPSSSSSE